MDLPSKQSVFDFSHVGELTGKKYEGMFTVNCCLNIAQKYALELEKTKLLGGQQNPTNGLAGFALILSSLKIKIIDGPDWWKQSNGGLNIEDEDVLVALFSKVEEVEQKWREDLKLRGKEQHEKK